VPLFESHCCLSEWHQVSKIKDFGTDTRPQEQLSSFNFKAFLFKFPLFLYFMKNSHSERFDLLLYHILLI
jgi:hypothetical protein